jgi:glycosyltransferase involved in cell wall biosynthesis
VWCEVSLPDEGRLEKTGEMKTPGGVNGSDITVCVLSYNRGAFLEEALASLEAQTCSPGEIVVLDNGSAPEVRERVEPFLRRGVRWEGVDVPQTPLWNFRRAFARTERPFLYVMHDDDRLLPSFLERQRTFLLAHPEIIAVACNAHEIDERGVRTGKTLHNPRRRRAVEFFPSRSRMVALYTRTYLAFPSVFYRTPFPAEVPMPEEYGQVADVVFLCELARLGVVAYVNEPLWEYRVHSGQDSSRFNQEFLRRLDGYFRAVGEEDPTIRRQIRAYLLRRMLSRKWKSLRRALGALLSNASQG